MTDRELLEAAAKAAGIVGAWGREGYIERAEGFIPSGWLRRWNPSDNSADAFDLAVRCRIDVFYYPGEVRAIRHQWDTDVCVGVAAEAIETEGADSAAATRRAIVRAAAAIRGG